jgi:hypothetical protein
LISRSISIFLCLSILLGVCLSSSNGVVLHVDEHGHVSIELPHLLHAHLHSQGADHEAHDFSMEADHSHLHDLLDTTKHITAASRQVDRRGTLSSAEGHPAADQAPIAFASPLLLEPSLVSVLRQSGQPPGPAARTERASLRAIILIV